MTIREGFDELLSIPIEQVLGALFAFGIGFVIVTALVCAFLWFMTD
jgi:hypothetical protein